MGAAGWLQQALLIADETAVPAAMGILEQLAQQANPPRVQAFFEVPVAGIAGFGPFPVRRGLLAAA